MMLAFTGYRLATVTNWRSVYYAAAYTPAIRRATLNDNEVVRSLMPASEERLDYVGCHYKCFISESNYVGYIAEVRGEVTVFPPGNKLKYDVNVAVDDNPLAKKSYYQSMFKLLFAKNTASYRCSGPQIIGAPRNDIVKVSEELLGKIFQDERLSKYFFPHQKILVYGEPFRSISANIQHVFWRGGPILIDSNSNLITVGCALPNELYLQYTIDVFGSNSASLRQHVISHINFAASQGHENIDFFVFHDDAIEQTEIDDIFNQNNINKRHQSCQKRLVFERQICSH